MDFNGKVTPGLTWDEPGMKVDLIGATKDFYVTFKQSFFLISVFNFPKTRAKLWFSL